MSKTDQEIPEKVKIRKAMSIEESRSYSQLFDLDEDDTTGESIRTIGLFDYFNHHPFDDQSSDSDEIILEYLNSAMEEEDTE